MLIGLRTTGPCFIDPTFPGIFACGPLQSFGVSACRPLHLILTLGVTCLVSIPPANHRLDSNMKLCAKVWGVWQEIKTSPHALSRLFRWLQRAIRQKSLPTFNGQVVFQLLQPQSPCGFSALARLYYLATKTAMLRRLRGQWNKIFMEIFFMENVTWFLSFFSGVLDWIVLILVWFKRSLHSAQVSGQSCPWPLKLMTSQAVERTWNRTGGHGRLWGEWVKRSKHGSTDRG